MGYGQFISSSYRAYAIDFDGDNSVDLFNSVDDAIGSIANYLKVHGWKKNGEIVAESSLNNVR
jgi:membrane-bound lytic murein transglycosylase B